MGGLSLLPSPLRPPPRPCSPAMLPLLPALLTLTLCATPAFDSLSLAPRGVVAKLHQALESGGIFAAVVFVRT